MVEETGLKPSHRLEEQLIQSGASQSEAHAATKNIAFFLSAFVADRICPPVEKVGITMGTKDDPQAVGVHLFWRAETASKLIAVEKNIQEYQRRLRAVTDQSQGINVSLIFEGPPQNISHEDYMKEIAQEGIVFIELHDVPAVIKAPTRRFSSFIPGSISLAPMLTAPSR